jgi:UDP-glucose 4-epimerase
MHKFIGEKYIELYNKLFGVEYCILRYFNVYGERGSAKGSYPLLIALYLDQKRRGEPLTITNDGTQKRDFTYVKDVAEANVLAINWTGIFNIGAGNNYSVNEIAEFVGGETINIGPRLGEPHETLADNTKASKNGWTQTTTTREWIYANRNLV